MKAFVKAQPAISLTHDPAGDQPVHLVAADGQSVAREEVADPQCEVSDWVELLREGLTFDLKGLAPGDATPMPAMSHRFDLNELPTATRVEAMHLFPGHHLRGGERTMPVVKGLMGLARDLVHHFPELQAIVWPASSSAIGRRFFESVTTAWLEGGPFPALGLTAFRETIDGALQTEGLGFWIDQELRIEPPLSSDKVSATRLGVRLVNHLVMVGGIEGDERTVAPDGSRLIMRQSRNGRFVRVWRE